MGRITTRRPVQRVVLGEEPRRRVDTLAVEEPLEIRVNGAPLAVTMRTPGHDVELAAGFLVSEGIIHDESGFRSAVHCGGPATGGQENTYNVLDVSLSASAHLPDSDAARRFYTTSSCGVCGKASIDAVETVSQYDVHDDELRISATIITSLPDRLRAEQAAFDKTGGLHAAGLFTSEGDLLVLREDVGRHNAVDKVVGWALLNGRLPLRGLILQVSGRASFELVQKATMAGVPMLTAVSAPSSLAVELADRAGLTLVGFLRGTSMNIYSHPQRVWIDQAAGETVESTEREGVVHGERI